MLEESFIYGGRVETPAGSQERDFFHITCYGLVHAIWKRLCRIGVIEASQAQFPFGNGWFALVPERSPGPGISADDAAMLGLDPGVMMQNAAGVEKLDAAELATHFEEETETGIDVVVWFGQSGAEHDDPAPDGWGDEEFFVTSQSLEP